MEIQLRYGIQQTVYFPLIDFGATDFESTPVTFAAGDVQLSKDGGTFTNVSNSVAHEGNGIYSLVLTATECQCTRGVLTLIDQTATKLWEDQAIIFSTQMSGQIEANLGILIREVDTATQAASTTAFEALAISPTTTEEATADHYNGRLILFTTGVLTGQMTDITDYALQNSKEYFTVTALTEAPADTDRFCIL
jgi:hypothetical protein